jgi:Lon protease-like protein
MTAPLPIFPLPNAVLFPNVFLPLHIFEPRYRQMTADALAGDRMIGMVLLRRGDDAGDEERPPVYRTGCTGLITHAEQLEDGRYNLVLRGIEKFTIEQEEPPPPGRLYRTAVVTALDETLHDTDRAPLAGLRDRLHQLLIPLFTAGRARGLPANMPDEDLVNALAQYLELDPLEKLALLERPGVLARCQSLIELLEMRAFSKDGSVEGWRH